MIKLGAFLKSSNYKNNNELGSYMYILRKITLAWLS